MTSYIVMTSVARRPGRYRNIAVVQLTPEYAAESRRPAMISTRAPGVLRIIRYFGTQHVGTTSRCEYQRALSEAKQIAERLNRQAAARPRARARARETA